MMQPLSDRLHVHLFGCDKRDDATLVPDRPLHAIMMLQHLFFRAPGRLCGPSGQAGWHPGVRPHSRSRYPATKEMMQPLSSLPASHLFDCRHHYRDDATLSHLPAYHLFGCGTKEMVQPLSSLPACHLFCCGTKEMMQTLSHLPASHLFDCKHHYRDDATAVSSTCISSLWLRHQRDDASAVLLICMPSL